jgi:hypothetical protein
LCFQLIKFIKILKNKDYLRNGKRADGPYLRKRTANYSAEADYFSETETLKENFAKQKVFGEIEKNAVWIKLFFFYYK